MHGGKVYYLLNYLDVLATMDEESRVRKRNKKWDDFFLESIDFEEEKLKQTKTKKNAITSTTTTLATTSTLTTSTITSTDNRNKAVSTKKKHQIP